MHELSICTAIARIAAKTAEGRPVQRVRVDVGQLRQVVPEMLVRSWAMVVAGTALEGSELVARDLPVTIECRRCGARAELHEPLFRCATCGSPDTDVVGGDELIVTSIDVTADEPQ